MLFAIDGKEIEEIPRSRKGFFDAIYYRMDEDQVSAIEDFLNKKIEEVEEVCVASWLPKSSDFRDTPLQAIHEACRMDYEACGKMFGLMVWDTLMKRPDEWYFIKQEAYQSMVYFKKG